MTNNAGFTPVATSNENAEAGFTPLPHPMRPAPAAQGVFAEGNEAERAPLAGEFEDFQRGFGEALGNIREEDDREAADAVTGVGARVSRGSEGSDFETPLWQQNRRQSRNMMWM